MTSTQELARCAVRIVTRDGLDRLAVRVVAQEAGIAVGTVYRHVTDLAHLVAVAAAQVEADFVADLRRAAPPEARLHPAVPAIARAVVARARTAPRLVELLAVPASATYRTDGAGIRAWITDRVDLAVRAGDIAPCDPELVAAAGFGLVRGALEAALAARKDPAGVEDLIAAGLAALLPPPTGPGDAAGPGPAA